jgi:NAD(P)-dependent dehydrogenase (short-subunit alcohol dehydrogenase family)
MTHVRTVIVTGGTGALGRAVVDRFLAAGDLCVVPWIKKNEREDTAEALGREVRSGNITLVEADISTEDGAARVAAAAPEVEILVNAAGGFAGGEPIYEGPLDLWDRMLRINLMTSVVMARAVLPGMIRRKRGSILNVASQAAFTRPAGIGAYTASKAALVAFTETLQKELASTELRVNAISPTTIDTPANRAAMPNADWSAWTPPARIAEVVFWLGSEEGRAVRGAVVPV